MGKQQKISLVLRPLHPAHDRPRSSSWLWVGPALAFLAIYGRKICFSFSNSAFQNKKILKKNKERKLAFYKKKDWAAILAKKRIQFLLLT